MHLSILERGEPLSACPYDACRFSVSGHAEVKQAWLLWLDMRKVMPASQR